MIAVVPSEEARTPSFEDDPFEEYDDAPVSRRQSEDSEEDSEENAGRRRSAESSSSSADRRRRRPRTNLELWLMMRGLESKYEALRSLGAKRVSDLAHLTPEDHEALGLSEREVKLLTIEVVG